MHWNITLKQNFKKLQTAKSIKKTFSWIYNWRDISSLAIRDIHVSTNMLDKILSKISVLTFLYMYSYLECEDMQI